MININFNVIIMIIITIIMINIIIVPNSAFKALDPGRSFQYRTSLVKSFTITDTNELNKRT